jgi:predicted secreted protein
MNGKQLGILAAIAGVVIAGAIALNWHRGASQQMGGGAVFPDLEASMAAVTEVRLSKGDGSKLTLKRGDAGWTVVERNFPADPSRVRDLVYNLAKLEVVEAKTRDPANYAKLGVETPSPTATSTLVEVVAGAKTWPLLIGKNANGKSIYVRKPDAAESAEVVPVVVADTDPKRWLDRLIAEVEGARVHQISVTPASGAAYELTRAAREGELVLANVPAGRTANLSVAAEADALTSLNFDDVQAQPAPAVAPTARSTWRTFDGVVYEFAGRKDGARSLITVTVRRDAALAAQFAAPPADAAAAKPADGMAPMPPAPVVDVAAAKAPAVDEKSLAALIARSQGVEYEIPSYKYDALFKPLESLLEPKPEPAAKKK